MDMKKKTLMAAGAVIALQVIDASLHIAINEVELLRILSNVVLVVAVSWGAFLNQAWRGAIWGGAIAYVALNLVFVALYGLENPVSGVDRTPLFGFMALSLGLSCLVTRMRQKEFTAQPA